MATLTPTAPGVYSCTFTASRPCAELTITPPATATVVEVDLDFGTLAEEDELPPDGPGGFLCLNDDDDNDNGVPDKDDVGTVTGEDDLVALSLSVSPTLTSGSVELKAIDTGTHVKFYKDSLRSEPLDPNVDDAKTWDLATEAVPNTVYVEGALASSFYQDVLLRLKYTDGTLSCYDMLKLTVVRVELEEIDFIGGVDIRVDETTDLPEPEWVRESREGANTTAPYASDQSARAAYVAGDPLQCLVNVSITPVVDGQITVRADVLGENIYGPFAERSIDLVAGTGKTTFQSAKSLGWVSVDTVDYRWELTSIDPGNGPQTLNHTLADTAHRVYTVKSVPVAPMAEPWLPVLELSCGMGEGLIDDTAIIEEITRGIHWSEWLFLSDPKFMDPSGTELKYNPDPEGIRVEVLSWSTAPCRGKIEQKYDLSNFLASFGTESVEQECDENTDLQPILLRSIGMEIAPLFLSGNPSSFAGGLRLQPTTSYWAGASSPSVPREFSFHQLVIHNGKIYDPSTRPGAGGDPFMGMTLTDYLDASFPGQVAAGYCAFEVASLEIGNVPSAPFTVTAVDPDAALPGTNTIVTVSGAGFLSKEDIRLRLVETGTTIYIPDGYITGTWIGSSTELTAVIVLEKGATPRQVEVLAIRGNLLGRQPFDILSP